MNGRAAEACAAGDSDTDAPRSVAHPHTPTASKQKMGSLMGPAP
ncbi:hypothetical protein D187_000901 [Cystobacter fuscus DSM 2262]|uniref:Uncharacterized protein n=1 Tax=Cystobacter fuscus (strain ATCC 25194 / DSM 2262 / NBRC 100088 / M29) TaxID=1242864 RepID=S9QWU7_CYSF2|nr:hypothetical protein D187_000901 [Cystobacter fuscus DSM 2262]